MSTVTGQNITDKASILLLDIGGVRWPAATELLGWVNSGMKEVVLQKPNALTLTSSIPMVAGTKQTIPSTSISLLELVRNMGADGLTPGAAIGIIDRNLLDTMNPYWHTSTPATETTNFCYDLRDLKTFYCLPPQPVGTVQKVEAVMSINPVTLTALSQVISLDDIYETVLIDYVLYRAFSKDAEHAANMQRADYYHKAFLSALGVKAQSESLFSAAVKFVQKQQQAQGAPQ